MKTSLLTFLTLLLFYSVSQAQDLDTVTISGRVTDQNAAVIPGAEIKITLTKTGAARITTSNAEGQYKLIQLEPGSYAVRVSFQGFAPRETTLTTVASQNLALNFTLVPSEISVAAVVITATDMPLIDTKRTVVGATLNAAETQLLPIPSRSALDLVFTLPGVTEEPLSTRDLAEDRNANPNSTPEEAGTFSLGGWPTF